MAKSGYDADDDESSDSENEDEDGRICCTESVLENLFCSLAA